MKNVPRLHLHRRKNPWSDASLFPVPYSLFPIPSPFPCSLFPIPCSLFPIPYSLFPVPCSLFPVPCSLFPIPYSLFPVPYSLFPIPCSLFPVPYSLFPIPCSLFPASLRQHFDPRHRRIALHRNKAQQQLPLRIRLQAGELLQSPRPSGRASWGKVEVLQQRVSIAEDIEDMGHRDRLSPESDEAWSQSPWRAAKCSSHGVFARRNRNRIREVSPALGLIEFRIVGSVDRRRISWPVGHPQSSYPDSTSGCRWSNTASAGPAGARAGCVRGSQAESRSPKGSPACPPRRKTPDAAARPAAGRNAGEDLDVGGAAALRHRPQYRSGQQRFAVGAHRHQPAAFAVRRRRTPDHRPSRQSAGAVRRCPSSAECVAEAALAAGAVKIRILRAPDVLRRCFLPPCRRQTRHRHSTACRHDRQSCGLSRPECGSPRPPAGQAAALRVGAAGWIQLRLPPEPASRAAEAARRTRTKMQKASSAQCPANHGLRRVDKLSHACLSGQWLDSRLQPQRSRN